MKQFLKHWFKGFIFITTVLLILLISGVFAHLVANNNTHFFYFLGIGGIVFLPWALGKLDG